MTGKRKLPTRAAPITGKEIPRGAAMKVDDIMQVIERVTHPQLLTKREAYDFMDGVIGECRMRMEALRDEMAEDE